MAGKKQKDEEILEADFDELSLDDIPGAMLPDPLDDALDAELEGPGASAAAGEGPMLKKVGGLRRKKKKKVGARAGGGGMMRKKKGLAARRGAAGGGGAAAGAAGTRPDGRSDAFDESVSSGREILKQMIQRLTPEEGEAEGKRKGMVQALRRVARGYRELEAEVARLEGKLGAKS